MELSICLKDQSPVIITLTKEQYYLLVAQIKSSATDETGKIIVRSVDLINSNKEYYTTGRMSHPSDKR